MSTVDVSRESLETTVRRRALTMHEVAAQIGVSYQTVRRLVREGAIASVSIGTHRRIPTEAIDEFLSGGNA